MAEDANARIRVDIDTAAALANIKNLQRQISAFHTSLAKSGAAASAASMQMQQSLLNSINKTGQFSATIKNVKTTTDSFTSSLEKNKLSMGEYFRYAGASTKTFGRLFRTEFDTINKVARERVKDLQTQYIKMGRDANGAMRAIAVRPLALDMENLSTKTQIAAQRQALLNQLLKQGSTNLLNFGKNTQWAGRQLMVGFTVPLVMLGSVAAKTFMDMEKQAVRFKRVYGEIFTTTEETNKALAQIKELANEFTKYGVAVSKTMELAADIAATGKMGADLNAQVAETTRLAVLGGVEQAEALQATIAITDAFGVSAEQLAEKIDFLNAVENQTITSIEDLTIAIPKAGPVVQQLGGDVEDLTFFLTAMREGGINASEGANALKSGLAALINPTGKASEMLASFGINIKGIVEANAGDVKGLVLDFATALDTLDPLNRARAIEQLFGKFQFSRLSTLFQNVIKDGNQASRVLKLTNATTAELAVLSERELKKVEDSPMFKFQKALEDIKVTLVPLGEAFLKAVTPILEFGTRILKKFDELDDGAKNFVVGLTAIAGVIGPVFLMGFGLIANGVANVIKGFVFFKTAMNKAATSSTQLGMQTEYMTKQQLEASAVAASLDQVHQKLRQTFTSEAIAVNGLTEAYRRAIAAQLAMTGGAISRTRPPKGAAPAVGYASGVLSVPGPKGAGDVVPAMLSPGEAVIPARQAQKYSGFISSMIADNVPGFRFGRNPFASMLGRSKVAVRMKDQDFISELRQSGKDARYKSAFDTQTGADYIRPSGSENTRQKELRSAMERDVFGLDPETTPTSVRPTYGYARTPILSSLINRLFGTKGKNFNEVTRNVGEGSLAKYGNIDLVTKGSVGKRSSAFAGDALVNYHWAAEAQSFKRRSADLTKRLTRTGVRPAPMSGASPEQLGSFDRLGSPFKRYDNDAPPYVETYTPGGFKFSEIDKIIARDPAIAKALRQELRAAGLGSIRVTGSNFVARLFKQLGIPGYENGVFSVPGQNGAGDVVPAMLAPGEAVIPAKQAEKYRGLIQSMVSGKIPGYQDSVDDGVPVESRRPRRFGLAAGESRLTFDSRFSVESGHMASGLEGLTREQAIARARLDHQQAISSGLYQRLGKDPDLVWRQFNENIRIYDPNNVKLFSNVVEPITKRFNTATANKDSRGLTAQEYLRELRRTPKGTFGSGILARLPQNHGIPDSVLSRYANDIQKSFTSQLKAEATLDRGKPEAERRRISEAQTSRMYATAVDRALSRIRDPRALQMITDSNAAARMLLTPGTPGDSTTGSGRSDKPIASLFGNVRDKTQDLFKSRGRFAGVMDRIFGSNFAAKRDRNFLPQASVMMPTATKEEAVNSLAGMSTGQKFRASQEFIRARGLEEQARPAAYRAILDDPKNSPDARLAAGIDKAADSKSPSKKLVDASAKNLVDGTVKGIEDGKRDVTKAGKSMATAFVDGTERVRVTEKGQFYDRNTNKRISEAAARKTMALDKQNERSRERAAARRELSNKRAAGISQTYGMTAKQYDALSQEQLRELKAQKGLADSKARALVTANGAEKEAERQRVANAAAVAQQKQQRTAARKERFAGMGGKVAGGASALGMGAMMYGMSGGPGAEIAGMLALPLMMAPMLTNKFALMAAAIVGLVAGFVILQNVIAGVRKESAEAARSLTSGKEAMLKFAEMAGTVTPSELLQKRREMQTSPFVVETGKTTFGQSFVQTEAGTEMLTAFEKQSEVFGRSRAIESLQKQLVTAVATGVLSTEQAQSIANSLGQKLNDYGITANINAAIQSIVGPDGKVLEGNTIQIYTEFIEGSTSGVTGTGGILQSEEFTNNANPFWWGDVEKVAKQEGEAAGIIANFYDENQQLIDAFDAENLKNIDALYDQGKYEEALAAEEAYQIERQALIKTYNAASTALQADFANADIENQRAILSQLVGLAKELDPKSGEAAYKLQKSSAIVDFQFGKEVDASAARVTQGGKLNEEQLAKEEAFQQVKVQFIGELAGGNIDSETFNGLMAMFDPTKGSGQDTLTLLAKISTEVGPQALTQLETVFQALDNPDLAARVAVKIENIDDPEKTQSTIDALSQLATFDGVGIEAKVILEYFGENEDKLEALQEKFTKLDDMAKKGQLDVQALVDQRIITTGDMDAIIEDNEYFSKLEPEQQVKYIQVFLSKQEVVAVDEIKAWRNANPTLSPKMSDEQVAKRISTAEAQRYTAAALFRDPTAIEDVEEGGGGSGPAASSLDDILKKLRDVRKNQIGVAKGFDASASAINKLFGSGAGINLFSGLENDMRRLGAEEDLITTIVGMDPEEFEKKKNTLFNFDKQTGEIIGFKAQLQNIGKALAAVALGQYVSDQQKSAKESRNQVLAFNQLRAAGFSVAEAYEAVEDAALASAVATGNVTRDQLNTMLAELRAAQNAMREAARLTPEGLQEVFEDGFNKAMEAFDAQEKKLTLEYELKIADDQKLIDDAQNQIDAIRYQIDDYEADLRGIEDQENAINETYDEKLDALEKVRKANQKVLDQEKGRLSVAEAITRGDLAAAARAIQDVRQTSASGYFSSQTDALNAARKSAIDAARGENGLSRIEIEERIEQLTNQIFEIEENSLEPAAERVRLAQIELQSRIDEQEVLGKTRAEWETIKNNIDLARVGSVGYKEDMEEALAVVQDVKDAWAGIQSKTVTLTVQTVNEGQASAGSGGTGSGGAGSTVDAAAEAAATLLAQQTAAGSWSSQYDKIKTRARNMNSAIPSVYSSDGIPKLLASYETAYNNAANAATPQQHQSLSKLAQEKYLALHDKLKSRGFNSGGYISGPGTGTSDSIPAMLSDGEYVIKAASVNKFGQRFLDAINAGRLPGFKMGGAIGGGSSKSTPAKPPVRMTADAAERRALATQPSLVQRIVDMAVKSVPLLQSAKEGIDITKSLINVGQGKATSEDAMVLGLGALNFIPGGKAVSTGVKATTQASKIMPALKNFIDFRRNPNEQVLSDAGDVGIMSGYVKNAAHTLFGSYERNRAHIDRIIRTNNLGIQKGTPLVRVANESDTEILKLLKPGQSVTLDRFMSVTSPSSKEFLEGMARGTIQTGGRRGGPDFPLYPMYKFNVKSDIPGVQNINKILPTPASKDIEGLLARGQNMKLIRITTDRKTGQQTYHFDIGKGIKARTGFEQLRAGKDNQDMIAGLIREGVPEKAAPYRNYIPGLGGMQNRSEWMPRYFANGGLVSKGTDTTPAMLTPGEFVVKKPMVNKYGTDLFNKLNSGSFSGGPSIQNFSSPSFNTQVSPVSINQGAITSNQFTPVSSNSVYNYSLSVNVASQSDPNVIAQTVMGQIRNIDSQRIRSNRF